jgi:protein-S-isoprenylcysteine O-methyltransferase Ste14
MNTWRTTVFGLVCLAFSLPILFHLMTHPALLRRRVHIGPVAEKDARQRLIVSLLLLCVAALGAVSGLDHEFGWSSVPVFVVLLGDLLIASGLLLIWLVFRANLYASATVKVEPGQTVISTGPYALVRHPMYSGGLLLFLGIPFALGSWWGLILVVPLVALILWRLKQEERYLCTHLPGYPDYCAKVTHRLIPFLW